MSFSAADARPSVLILEDNPLDIELAQSRLQQAGYDFEVHVASNRSDFLEKYAQHTWHLILADYALPDFDGLSALEIVRRDNKYLPFIFVSGVLGEEVAVETLHRGATDYVLKARMERLVPAIRRALKEYDEHCSRVQAEIKLRESELLFEQVTNALPAMVWTASADGELLYCNDIWREYFGSDDRKSWCEPAGVHIEDISQTRRSWRDALSTGKALELECRLIRAADQVPRWHLVRAVPVTMEGSQLRWVGTCTDVQMQKERDESLRVSEKLAIVGRMAGAIAHEINNPLESLVNLLYLLKGTDTRTDPGRGLLEEADQQLFRISSITRQTLTYYRGKAVLGHIDCGALFEDTVSLFRAKLRARKITPLITVDGNVQLQGITGELRQVLVNLVSNAIDASPEDGVLRLHASKVLENGIDFVQIEVEDSGHGIQKDLQSKLFQPFFSTKGSLGTGLGLWVTKSIVDKHRGEIRLQSQPGQTIFTIMLPAEYVEEASPRRNSSSLPDGLSSY
uniref:histidine kinase n=1 Tax=Acidobacterium capsulatum TaxID=33075 RepID=A0A7V5CT87_9BACT